MSEIAVIETAPLARPANGEHIHVTYVPRPGLGTLAIVNFLLNVVTLSIYRFWAKTRVRRHIWSCVHINGEPLEYTGTGKELFLGALIVFLVFILPLVALVVGLSLWYGPEHPLISVVQFAGLVLVLLLTGMALYRARRYRLSRTLWRGIRGTLVGSSWGYSLLYFAALLLKSLTLGWATPSMNVKLQGRITRETRFGDMPFTFEGRAAPLYPAYALSWVGTLVLAILAIAAAAGVFWKFFSGEPEEFTGSMFWGVVAAGLVLFLLYGIVWTIYQAREMNAFAAYTGLDRARFKLRAKSPSLSTLWIGNMAILLLTLGIGAPFILQRSVRYVCDRLTVEGTVDIERIRQTMQPLDKRGEGLVEAFDLDGF
jgi:uncharacterized membrane protein YjgN (DUF898 family)